MKKWLISAVTALVLTAGAPLVLAQVQTPGDMVITNARIIDGAGNIIDNGSIVVRDGRIVSVGSGRADTAGAWRLDARGGTVMPGYIDGHRHLIRGDADRWLEEQSADRMREFLGAGFTTLQSAGDDLDGILELRRRIAEGELDGPRIVASGRVALGGPAGTRLQGVDGARVDPARPPNRPTEAAAAIDPEETRAAVARLAEAGVDAIKTSIVVSPGGPEKETLAIVTEEARRHGIRSITHAVTVEDTVAAVEAGTDVLVHTPHIGWIDENEGDLELVAESGIPMVSTLGIFIPAFVGRDPNVPVFRDGGPFPMNTLRSAGQGPVNARLLADAGVTYGFGTDVRFHPLDSLAIELRTLQLVFSPHDIVRILTGNAAATVGLADEVGTLEPGKAADIVIVNGNPLENVTHLLDVAMVIRDGRVVLDQRQ